MKTHFIPQKRNAVIYARVSSEEQEKEGYSIPSQQKLLREYAAREQITVLAEFVDVETAKMPGRPGFDGMLDFFRKGLSRRDQSESCHVLLVEKTDRLYRNLKDYVTVDELKIEIHFVKENTVLSPDSHSSEKFMHGIKVLMAKNYIDNLSEETSKGMLEKARQGIWPLRAPLGYRNVEREDGKRVIEPDPLTAPVIIRLFEVYAAGNVSLAELSQMAKDAGLVAPRSKRPLTRQKLHRIFGIRLYYGEFLWKGKIYLGTHQPLISRELWEQVQAILASRGIKKPRKVKHKLAFSGLISCGHCGCSLVGEIQKGRYIYYHCSGYKGRCQEPYVREEVLEQKFVTIIKGLVFDAEVLEWLSAALRDSHRDECQFHLESISRLRTESDRLQARIEQMYIDKLDGKIDASFFEAKSALWRAEQTQILKALEQHQHANQSYLLEGIGLVELVSQAAALFEIQDAREKRRLLDFVLSNCTWKNGELTPVFRQPFDIIADGARISAGKKAGGSEPDDLCLTMGG